MTVIKSHLDQTPTSCFSLKSQQLEVKQRGASGGKICGQTHWIKVNLSPTASAPVKTYFRITNQQCIQSVLPQTTWHTVSASQTSRLINSHLSINRHSFQLKVAFNVPETRAAAVRGHGILTHKGSSASVESIHEKTKMDAGDLQPDSAVNHDVWSSFSNINNRQLIRNTSISTIWNSTLSFWFGPCSHLLIWRGRSHQEVKWDVPTSHVVHLYVQIMG